jgi:hypothetical protein
VPQKVMSPLGPRYNGRANELTWLRNGQTSESTPATYFGRDFVTAGGLISYGPDAIDTHRRAAEFTSMKNRRRR